MKEVKNKYSYTDLPKNSLVVIVRIKNKLYGTGCEFSIKKKNHNILIMDLLMQTIIQKITEEIR